VRSATLAVVLVAWAVATAAGASGPDRAPAVRTYETPYYLIHTDLEPPVAAEAVVRAKVMGEEFRRRTRELGFTGRIDRRLPFHLMRRREDYLATGAPAGSAGAFLGDRLVAVATGNGGGPAWHVVQHEAFHQFAAAHRGGELLAWANEGLAEYFGEALFTGDSFVTGVVPAWRLARVKRSFESGTFQPLPQFLAMTQEEWNEKVTADEALKAHYDQAWSVVQYLLHADNGKHRGVLVGFITSIGTGKSAGDAWREQVHDIAELEAAWWRYWIDMPDDATADLYATAAVQTLTGLRARAAAAGQSFKSFDEFLDAARKGRVKFPKDQWLPPSLVAAALEWTPKDARWGLTDNRVELEMAGTRRFVGRYDIESGRVMRVHVVETR
jgi:hypothetical protein